MPLFSQSPYRVGSGPFGPCNSLGAGFASAAAADLRASASASARLAAGESGLRSAACSSDGGREGLSVIDAIPAMRVRPGLEKSQERFLHLAYSAAKGIRTFPMARAEMRTAVRFRKI